MYDDYLFICYSKISDMGQNKIMDQFAAVFSVFMVFFYLGIGIYVAFFFESSLDKSALVILGISFIFYGLYRAYRAYVKIVEVFFTADKDDDN